MWGMLGCGFHSFTPFNPSTPYPRPLSRSSRYNAMTITKGNSSLPFPSVNNVPSCANDWLLNETLRGSWNFDG